MSSRKSRKTARINGAKAAGCKSPEGLQKSSMNAIRHGLTSETLVLSNESQTQFNDLLQGYLRKFNPRDTVEDDLVTEMVAARWRLQRIWLIQSSTLDLKMAMMESELEELFIKAVPGPARISLAFAALANHEKTLQLLLRYESTYRRIYNQAQKDLLRLRESERCEKLRNEPPAAPKPRPATAGD